MADEILLKSGTVEITTKVARFGGVSYQVANIGSVGVHVVRKFNPIAVAIFVAATLLGFYTYQLKQQYSDNTIYFFSAALLAFVASIAVQLIWPKLVSTLVMKTSSNDVEKMESTDLDAIYAIQHAIEDAFIRRGWA